MSTTTNIIRITQTTTTTTMVTVEGPGTVKEKQHSIKNYEAISDVDANSFDAIAISV